jgi:hypothetical protein
MIELSIIILSYNTKEITKKCLDSLYDSIQYLNSSEIIIVDNASSDGSREMIQTWQKIHSTSSCIVKTTFNLENKGYPKGNNQGLSKATGSYILFLNSDVVMKSINFKKILYYLKSHPSIGALTVKVMLTNGTLDKASHRGFPTIWNSFCYFFKFETLFGSIPIIGRLFGGYHLSYKNLNTIHEIDSPIGAFYMVRSDVLRKLNGFDEQFFMYGEDLDLSYRIKEQGYSIMYYPLFEVTHLKYASGLKKNDLHTNQKTKQYFYDAMKIFYRKHYESKYPWFFNRFIYFFINLKSKF